MSGITDTLAAFREHVAGAGRRAARLRERVTAGATGVSGRALRWGAAAAALVLVAFLANRSRVDPSLTALVSRGPLVVRLVEAGTLKPASSMTYRSPLGGREAEIVFLVPEGTLVKEGDLLVRLDTTELQRERARIVRELRQAEVDLKLAEAERQDGLSGLDSITEGQRALEVDEARAQVALAERKTERLAKEYEALESLRQRGFVTQDELEEAEFALEQSRSERELARRKAAALERGRPRERLRAELQLAQREAQRENVVARVRESREQLQAVDADIEGCGLYARAPGLVVHEDYLGANPRRKVRVGDRVTGSQGIVTIPEVTRMVVEASIPESQVHRLQKGQPAIVRLDAFPERSFPGQVGRVGTLARSQPDRPFEGKRFDFTVDLAEAAPELRPEMTARVEVTVAERPEAVLVPVNAVFQREGAHVCHVVGLMGLETRRVQLGEADELHAEVLGGLRAGERVSLLDAGGAAPPPQAAPGKPLRGVLSREGGGSLGP